MWLNLRARNLLFSINSQRRRHTLTLLKATWRETRFADLGKVTPRMITQPSRWILLPTARWVPLTLLLTARPVAVQAFSWDEYSWSDWIPSVSVKLSDVLRITGSGRQKDTGCVACHANCFQTTRMSWNFSITFICLCSYTCVWRSEESFVETVLSFHCAGPRDQTQEVRLGGTGFLTAQLYH